MKNLIIFLYLIGTILIIFLFVYSGYKIKRYFNWEFSYKSNVEKIIKEQVKPSCLIKE